MCDAHAVAMTASLFVTGTRVAWVGRDVSRDDDGEVPVVDAVHAVARPVVDGLELSACGVLVTAAAADDWRSARSVPRCAECSRIAG
jgi:hypothetical protein